MFVRMTVAKHGSEGLSGGGFFLCPGECFIEKESPFSYDENKLKIKAGCIFDLDEGENWCRSVNREDVVFDPRHALDEGSVLEPGVDYSIFLCLSGTEPKIVVSKNATFPKGYKAKHSRRIGGFHFGSIRKVSEDGLWVPIDSNGVKFGETGVQWRQNVTVGIVPNSVWDLKNRPKTLFGGLVRVGNIWVSIYQASKKANFTFMRGENLVHVTEGGLQSQYGQFPVSGIDGLCQYNFAELAERAGMRLLTYTEWLAAAYGAPQGEDDANRYGWCDTTNKVRARTGCSVSLETGGYDAANGAKPFAISAKNVVDTTGNVWEWLSEYTNRHDAGEGVWTYYDQLGPGMGQIYGWKTNSFSAFAAGGHWHRGAFCGPRAINPDDQPWNVNVHIGSRLACDSL
ncbi:MAG: SUMF1/EgtB/PvdO family nonheme iron enzyme [Christensenella sp.]